MVRDTVPKTTDPPRESSIKPTAKTDKLPTIPRTLTDVRTENLTTAEMQRQIRQGMSSTPTSSIGMTLAKKLRKSAGGTTESYMTYGVTQSLFKTCSVQASYFIPPDQRMGILTGTGPPKTAGGEDLGVADADHTAASAWWFGELGMEPTFSTWQQVAFVHMYTLTVRLRAMDRGAVFQNYQRYLLEHFSHAAEDRMLILHGMQARGIRNKYLKDLFLQWRGVLAAYDEGLVKGDAVLAGAVWRNVFKGREDVDWVKVGVVVAYMRKVMGMLASVEVNQLNNAIQGRNGIFETARRDLVSDVLKRSKGIDEPFEKES